MTLAPYDGSMLTLNDRDHGTVFAAVAGPRDGRDAEAAWADDAGLHGPTRLADAVTVWAGRPVVLRDPLFEAAWVEDACAARDAPPPLTLDWLVALAPFGQARGLSALLARAEETVDEPDGPRRAAAILHAVYMLAASRAA